MGKNLLKTQIDCICKEYLAGIFPALGKCAHGALETLFGGIVTGKSTLVTDLARPVRRDSSAAEAKRVNERVSAWLGRWDFVSGLNPWLLGKAAEEASDEATFALDFSDITVKQEFGLEKARVRTFRRLENLFALCNLAYVFATDYLREVPGFRKVLKLLADNLETVSTKTHALLAGIRALAGIPKVRFISGRPRKVHPPDPLQLLLAF